MNLKSTREILGRIQSALEQAVEGIRPFVPGAVASSQKSGGKGPVTEADHTADRILRARLLRDGEGWLSEESADDLSRLGKELVWVVDPLDGTREFVEGIPEWCVSVGLVENGRAIAGGICNPATNELFLGSSQTGVNCNGKPVRVSPKATLESASVLASRSETRRGEWGQFEGQGFTVVPMGSVAYKLARVAAGLADATWTLSPKNEWDVAAGIALIEAAGGVAETLEGSPAMFNRKGTLYSGLIACGPQLFPVVKRYLGGAVQKVLSSQTRT